MLCDTIIAFISELYFPTRSIRVSTYVGIRRQTTSMVENVHRNRMQSIQAAAQFPSVGLAGHAQTFHGRFQTVQQNGQFVHLTSSFRASASRSPDDERPQRLRVGDASKCAKVQR